MCEPQDVIIPKHFRGRKVPTAARHRYRLYTVQNGECCYCDKPMWLEGHDKRGTPERRATLEHIKPASHGGTKSLSNLLCSCQECNTCRGAIPHDEFKIIRKMGGKWAQIAKQYKAIINHPQKAINTSNAWVDVFKEHYEIINPDGFGDTLVMKMQRNKQFIPSMIVTPDMKRKKQRKKQKRLNNWLLTTPISTIMKFIHRQLGYI